MTPERQTGPEGPDLITAAKQDHRHNISRLGLDEAGVVVLPDELAELLGRTAGPLPTTTPRSTRAALDDPGRLALALAETHGPMFARRLAAALVVEADWLDPRGGTEVAR